MFFAKKTKGFCVEFGEQAVLLARTSQADTPLVVEELKEFAPGDAESVKAYVKGTEGKGPTGYAHAKCSVYPPRRLVRRHTLDLKRVKEPGYLNEVLTQQFRLEPEKQTTVVLNASDGSEYDPANKANLKEVLFCSLPTEEVVATQDSLLAQGIYPERLEIGTIATLGGLVNYLNFRQSKIPLLFLEVGEEATQSFILSGDGVDISRPIPSGIAAMIPVVQKELGLKDEESAKKLFYSNTFDFTSMGGTLIKKLLKELQSSIGFYEVQTGQSIGGVLCAHLPPNLAWLGQALAASLGVPQFKLDLPPWLEAQGIRLADGVAPNPLDERWLGLFALMSSLNHEADAEQKK